MKLSEKQSDFLWMVNDLLTMIKPALSADGYLLKITEWNRTPEQQLEYYKKGLSGTMRSKHLKGLAVDFAVIEKGKYMTDVPLLHIMGNYWIKIGGVWGGEWLDPYDPYHFEYNESRRVDYLADKVLEA